MSSRNYKKELAFDISSAMESEELRKAAVYYAEHHSYWYETQSNRMGVLWNYLTFAIIVLSAISSIVTAYNADPALRWIPATLSALSAFCAAYLTQFRVRDLWQIREAGRIDAEKLVAKAQAIPIEDPKSTFEQAIALRLELHELERDQTQQFFAVPKSVKTSEPPTHSEN